jgi:hypothetical protein
LTDLCLNSISNDIIVVVTNTAPYFIVPSLPIYSTSLNTKKEILIDQVKDNEGHTIVMTLSYYFPIGSLSLTLPSFIT